MRTLSNLILPVVIALTLILSSNIPVSATSPVVSREPTMMAEIPCISLNDHLPINGIYEEMDYADINTATVGLTTLSRERTLVDNQMQVWGYENGGALHISVMIHDSTDPATSLVDQLSVVLLVPGQTGEPIDVKTILIEDTLNSYQLDQHQISHLNFGNDTNINGYGAAARYGEYQFFEFRIPLDEDFIEDLNLPTFGMNSDNFQIAAFFYYGDDSVFGAYNWYAGVSEPDYILFTQADENEWFPDITCPSGSLEWDSSIIVGEHYSMLVEKYNMTWDTSTGLPWAENATFEFKAYLTLPTYNYTLWMLDGGIVGMLGGEFENLQFPFIVPINLGTANTYIWEMGVATHNYYNTNPDVNVIYTPDSLEITNTALSVNLYINWDNSGVCTEFDYKVQNRCLRLVRNDNSGDDDDDYYGDSVEFLHINTMWVLFTLIGFAAISIKIRRR